MVDDDIRSALDGIESQWNTAEEYIKKVERLRRGIVVVASINELRYAGRRMVEAYKVGKEAGSDPERRKHALDLLREVKHFCLRARHDALDSAVTYIDQALAVLEKEFGADLLHDRFPHYLSMKTTLRHVSEIMAKSRGNPDSRDLLYSGINDEEIERLIENHHDLETSKVVLEAAYAKHVRGERREGTRFLANIILAAIIAVGTIVLVVIEIVKHSS